MRNVTVIGTTTRGSTGQVAVSSLRYGGPLVLSAKRIFKADGEELSRYGVSPDVRIVPEYEEYLTKDIVLEYVLTAHNSAFTE